MLIINVIHVIVECRVVNNHPFMAYAQNLKNKEQINTMEDLVKKEFPNNNSKSFVTRSKIKSSVKKTD